MKRYAMVLVAVLLVWVPRASGTVFLYQGFETAPVGWQAFGEVNGQPGVLWHRETHRAAHGMFSAAYNTGYPNYDYDVGVSWGMLASPWLDLSSATEVYLDFNSWLETENWPYGADVAFMCLKGEGTPWVPIPVDLQLFPQSTWNHFHVDLSWLAGAPVGVRVGFYFNSVDAVLNDFEGWYVDDVAVHDGAGPPPIPEPSTMLLLGTGLVGIGAAVTRRFAG